ncbi:hypothetical protein GC096_21530 [Paenibacillus sp. LMG 31461]|uniref:Uncharacterized protein n=1 Tax=Paenibacillus plantarum TaxID=2654975 RepID=A0ABX1XDW7_9BACL|nr:hypothetical protein [Paenibacillus plantarum]NOU66629.1 hypothetical protein [Paenibacillus plantarum]
MTNIQPFLKKVRRSIDAHRISTLGGYSHKISESLEADLYGTADAVILLYTIGELPPVGSSEHESLVKTLQGFQQPDDGLFNADSHHPVHRTAYAVAALELLDSKPCYPLTGLHHVKSREGIQEWMESLDWAQMPWRESHKGAGIYAAMVLAGEVDQEWEQWYFAWLDQEADPETGFWRKGSIHNGAPLFHHLASSFHYLFNQNYRKRPLRYPNQWVDTCLAMQVDGQIPLKAGALGFVELDVLYTLISVGEQTQHRANELQAMIKAIGNHLLSSITALADGPEDGLFEDMHSLCGTVCALALVQSVMPEQVNANRVLQKILDRRPFI